jgi:fermentation-respiration switch protein FrsA (DUF1100 family)
MCMASGVSVTRSSCRAATEDGYTWDRTWRERWPRTGSSSSGSMSRRTWRTSPRAAGLSVLAATDPQTKQAVGGVIGLGLPDLNELGWRLRDSVIYLTHGTPKEPTFSTAAVVDRMSPVPFAAIHSTRDEFVPVAEVERTLQRANEPKRLWVIQASDHRFSDNLQEFDARLLEAMQWVKQNQPR